MKYEFQSDKILYRFFKEEPEERVWKPIPNKQEAIDEAIRKDAMFVTWTVFDRLPVDGEPDQPMRYGNLVLDFDCKNDPGKALQDLRSLCLVHLPEYYTLDPNAISFYASGGKGFHAEIPAECLGAESGDQFLPLAYKKLVANWKETLELATLDMSLYCMGKGKMFRLPNVRRSNGRYKVPLTLDEIQALTIEQITELTKRPREIEPVDGAEYSCPDLGEDYRNCLAEVHREQAEMKESSPIDPEILAKLRDKIAQCIAYILTANPKTGRTTFNNLVMIVVSYFQTAGFEFERVLQIVDPFLQKYSKSTSYTTYQERLKHFRAQWSYISGHESYRFSCKFVLGKGFPGSAFDCKKCPLKCDNSIDPSRETDQWERASELFPPQSEFPFDIFPDAISESLHQLARSCATSPNSLAGASLAIFCSVLGRTVFISPKASWASPLILWIGDVKASGQGKTPPVKMLMKPLWDFQHAEDERVDRVNTEEMQKKPKERMLIRGRSYLLTDLTLESLRAESKVCPTGGILYHADELSALIGSQNQYKSGKGTDREGLLNIWSGTGCRVGRVSESFSINMNLNIIGGIQPPVFRRVFGADDGFFLADGTVSRILWTFEPEANYLLTDESWNDSNRNIWDSTIGHAKRWSDHHINDRLSIHFSHEAFGVFAEWRNKLVGKAHLLPPEIRVFLPKAAEYVVRLSGTIKCQSQLVKGHDPSPDLNTGDIKSGILAAEYYLSHAVSAIRNIKDGFIPEDNVSEEQKKNLATVLDAIRDKTEAGRLAIGFICDNYNRIVSPEKPMTPKGMGSLIRRVGMDISASLEDANERRRVHCLIWNEKIDTLIKQCLQSL